MRGGEGEERGHLGKPTAGPEVALTLGPGTRCPAAREEGIPERGAPSALGITMAPAGATNMECIPNLASGQALLASLSRRSMAREKLKESAALSPASSQKATSPAPVAPTHAIPVEESVLFNPAAEVRSLPDRLSTHEMSSEEGLQRMIRSKETRHNRAYAKLKSDLKFEDSRHKGLVGEAIVAFQQQMAENSAYIDSLFAALEEERLILLEEEQLRDLWDEIMSQFPKRRAWAEDLNGTLGGLERRRKGKIDALLLAGVGRMLDIAHMTEGGLQRLLEKDALDMNTSLLENMRLYSDFQRRLQTHDVLKEKQSKEALEQGLESWRLLRARHAINCFQNRIRSDALSSPPRRSELLTEIMQKQSAALEAVQLLLASAADMLPPTMPSKEKVAQWLNALSAEVDSWTGETDALVAALWRHEEKLQAMVKHELDLLEEEIKGYAAWSKEALDKALAEDCISVVEERELRATTLIRNAEACLVRQYAAWNLTCSKLGTFLGTVIEGQENHGKHMADMDAVVKEDMRACRAAFSDANTGRENQLEEAREEIYRSNTSADLENKVTGALSQLDAIEEGYRSFHKDMLGIVHRYPVQIAEANLGHWVRMCGTLYIASGVTGGEDGNQPEGAEEPTDAEADPPGAAAGAGPGAEDGDGEGAAGEEGQAEEEPIEDVYLETPIGPHKLVSDIYVEIFVREPKPEAKEGEDEGGEGGEGAGAEAASPDKRDEAGAKEESPDGEGDGEGEEGASPPPATVDPADPNLNAIDAITIEESLLRDILSLVQKEILTNIKGNADELTTVVSSWSYNQEEQLTDELDLRLRSHRPRAGRIEEEDREFRSVELAGQTRRFDRHVRRAVHMIKVNTQQHESEVKRLDGMIEESLGKIKSAEAHLSSCASVKGLDIRMRETLKLKTKLLSFVQAEFSAAQTAAKKHCDELVSLNLKFREDNFNNPNSSTSYGEETVKKSNEHLSALNAEAQSVCENQIAQLDARAKDAVEKLESAHINFESMTGPHRDDLSLLESLDGCLNQARSALRHRFDLNHTMSERILAQVGILDKMCVAPSDVASTADDEAVFEGLVRKAFAGFLTVDMLLSLQCKHLECLEGDVSNAELDAKVKAIWEGDDAMAEALSGSLDAASMDMESTFKGAVDALVAECRENLTKTAEAYYSTKEKGREITRKARIPEDVKIMKEQIETFLTDLNEQAAKHSTSALSQMRSQIILAARSIERLPSTVLGAFVGGKADAMAQKLHSMLSDFLSQYDVTRSDREEHEHSLRPSLANPLLKAEFDSLCSDEDARAKRAVEMMRLFAKQMLDAVHASLNATNGFLYKLVKSFAFLMDGLVYTDDISIAHDPSEEGQGGIQAKHFMALKRFEAFKTMPATRTDVKGRKFKERVWEDVDEVVSLEAIGCSVSVADLLGPQMLALVQGEEGEEEPAAAYEAYANEGTIKSLETPLAHALMISHSRALKRLKGELTTTVGKVMETLNECIKEEREWQMKWPRAVQGVLDL